MDPILRATASALLALVAAGCALTGPIPTSSPSSAPSVEPTPTTPSPSPTPTPPPTPEPTPGLGDVPRLAAGQAAITNAPGLRVRSRPGTEQRVITSLGFDAELLVVLGPVFIDGIGWYLVRDADAAEPAFGEGWVAAGFEPDPFLVATGAPADPRVIAGFAHDAAGEYGPILLPQDRRVRVRWIAAALDADGCSFAADFEPTAGEAVRAVRATVGTFPAPGDLLPQFFEANPALTGSTFLAVTSDCSWALTFERETEPTPEPSAE